MESIEFDAVADITVATLRKRAKTFQSFYLDEKSSSFGKLERFIWTVLGNQDRGKDSYETRDRTLGDVTAALYRPKRIIIAVSTTSPEFAHKFAEWLQQHCGAVLLSQLPPVLPKPSKKVGAILLTCNKWAAEQILEHGASYDDIFAEWKRLYQKQTKNNPDEVLADPRKSLRQAISEERERRRQDIS
jgi:hypothetical protein